MLSGYDREHRIFGFLFEVSSLRVRPYLLESSFGKLVVGTFSNAYIYRMHKSFVSTSMGWFFVCVVFLISSPSSGVDRDRAQNCGFDSVG